MNPIALVMMALALVQGDTSKAYDMMSLIGFGALLGQVAQKLCGWLEKGPKAITIMELFQTGFMAYLAAIFAENIRSMFEEQELPVPEQMSEPVLKPAVLIFLFFSGFILPVFKGICLLLHKRWRKKPAPHVAARKTNFFPPKATPWGVFLACVALVVVVLGAIWKLEGVTQLFLLVAGSGLMPLIFEQASIRDLAAANAHRYAMFEYREALKAFDRGEREGPRPRRPKRAWPWRMTLAVFSFVLLSVPFLAITALAVRDPERLEKLSKKDNFFIRIVKTIVGADRDAFNPFDIIGVPPTASMSEIKSAFRKQALRFHPDKNPNNPEAAAKFELLQRANDLLTKDAERLKYEEKTKFGGMQMLIDRSLFITQQVVVSLGLSIVMHVGMFLFKLLFRRGKSAKKMEHEAELDPVLRFQLTVEGKCLAPEYMVLMEHRNMLKYLVEDILTTSQRKGAPHLVGMLQEAQDYSSEVLKRCTKHQHRHLLNMVRKGDKVMRKAMSKFPQLQQRKLMIAQLEDLGIKYDMHCATNARHASNILAIYRSKYGSRGNQGAAWATFAKDLENHTAQLDEACRRPVNNPKVKEHLQKNAPRMQAKEVEETKTFLKDLDEGLEGILIPRMHQQFWQLILTHFVERSGMERARIPGVEGWDVDYVLKQPAHFLRDSKKRR